MLIMDVSSICDSIRQVYDKAVRTPHPKYPPILVWCSYLTRPGLSVTISVGNIIQSLSKKGIPTEDGADGQPNFTNKLVHSVVSEIYRAMKEDFYIQTASGPGSVQVTTTGSNAGGMVVGMGPNVNVIDGGAIGS